MSGSVQVHAAPHMPRMMGPPPRYPPPSQMNHHHHSSPHHGHRQRLAYQPYRLFPRPPPPGAAALGSGNAADGSEYDGRRLRKSLVRKTVDYNAAVIKQIQNRVWQRDHRDRRMLEPDYSYGPDTVPPAMQLDNSTNAVTTRYVKSATNKMRCPIFSMAWTPEGRRLVTGASSGEFTLWNGLTFNFETILQAHDSPVRSMVWSHNDIWMVTGDHAGYVKYWQSNMNNVKMYQAHKEAVRGLSFSPSDQKFASCSDDGTVRIWDFYTCYEEKVLRGHGADVKCVDWHPHKGIIVSGSKDNQQPIKIWDPKAGIPLATIHAHKSTVMDARWNRNGNWLVTASRDHLVKLFDIRKLSQELQIFRGHKKEASCVSWHPIHEDLFATGGSDGSILFWNVGCDKEVGSIEAAHENIIWTLAWHPVGHILCSGSNDHTSKFWTRQKPGDVVRERGHAFHDYSTVEDNDMEEAFIPGMGPEDKVDTGEEDKDEGEQVIPGLDIQEAEHSTKQEKLLPKKTPYQKPIPKKFQAIWNDSKEDELEDDRGRNPPVFTKTPSGPGPIGTNAAAEIRPGPPPSEPPMGGGGGGGFEAFNPNVGFGPMGTSSGIYIGPDRNERMDGPPPGRHSFPTQQQRQQGPPPGHGYGGGHGMNQNQEENMYWGGGPGQGRGPPQHEMRMPPGHGMNRGPSGPGGPGPRGMRPRMRMGGDRDRQQNPNRDRGGGGWNR